MESTDLEPFHRGGKWNGVALTLNVSRVHPAVGRSLDCPPRVCIQRLFWRHAKAVRLKRGTGSALWPLVLSSPTTSAITITSPLTSFPRSLPPLLFPPLLQKNPRVFLNSLFDPALCEHRQCLLRGPHRPSLSSQSLPWLHKAPFLGRPVCTLVPDSPLPIPASQPTLACPLPLPFMTMPHIHSPAPSISKRLAVCDFRLCRGVK